MHFSRAPSPTQGHSPKLPPDQAGVLRETARPSHNRVSRPPQTRTTIGTPIARNRSQRRSASKAVTFCHKRWSPPTRALPPIGTARCLLAVMTAAGQNRLFGASGICRLAGPVPASCSLRCLQLPLRFSRFTGCRCGLLGRRDVLAGADGFCSRAQGGCWRSRCRSASAVQVSRWLAVRPWRVVSPVNAWVEQRTDSKPGRLGVIQAGA
jgi:hypothetical protein